MINQEFANINVVLTIKTIKPCKIRKPIGLSIIRRVHLDFNLLVYTRKFSIIKPI